LPQPNQKKGNERNVEKIVTKMFHARVGVLTKKFSEETTSRFAAKAKTEPLRLELKIKSRDRTIATSAKIAPIT